MKIHLFLMWVGGIGVVVVFPVLMFLLSRAGAGSLSTGVRSAMLLLPVLFAALFYYGWRKARP